MNLIRFLMFFIILSAPVLFASPESGVAAWSDKPIFIIVHSPPSVSWPANSNPDLLVLNALIPKLNERLNTSVSIIYRPGGNGVLAANQLVAAKPDGYTMALLPLDAAVTKVASSRTPYISGELTPLTLAWRQPLCVVTRLEAPYNNMNEFKEYAKSKSARLLLTDGHQAGGSLEFVLAFMLSREGGWEWEVVSGKTVDPTQLLNNEADVAIMKVADVLNHPQTARLKILAVDDPEPPACRPSLSTLAEQGFKSRVPNWRGFYYPGNLQDELALQMSREIVALLHSPELTELKKEHCLTGPPLTRTESQKWLQQEYSRQYSFMKELRLIEP